LIYKVFVRGLFYFILPAIQELDFLLLTYILKLVN